MLALLALLVLPSKSMLPDPFLSQDLEPVLPIQSLKGVPRAAIGRGGFWRAGGYVRINYYYKFPAGTGPAHSEFMRLPGMAEEQFTMGPYPGPRAARTLNGVRQLVWVTDVKEGERWPWAKLIGPARVVTVSEIPQDSPVPAIWHRTPELLRAPIPTTFPPAIKCLSEYEVTAIVSDPIIPRTPRQSFSMQVHLKLDKAKAGLVKLMRLELDSKRWKEHESGENLMFSRQNTYYGLHGIEVKDLPVANGTKPLQSAVTLHYTYTDSVNGPRLVD
jgi:hypothetical protein